MITSLQTHVRLMYLFEPPVVYITHEDAKFNFTKFTRPGEICRACEQHTPKGAGGEFGPTLRENQQKYGSIFFGVQCGFYTRVLLFE
jgi:hypothetical protein